MTEFVNYYEILQVSPTATLEEIKAAFRRLAREYHPDVNPNNPAAEVKFKQINQAYQILGDPHQRYLYDQQVNFKVDPSSPSPLTAEDYYRQGLTKIQRQSYLEAIKNFTKAIELNPNFLEAYLRRIEAFYKSGKDRQVLEDCQKVLQIHPNCSQAYYYLGCSRQRLGYTQSAIEAYSQAIFYQPYEAEFYHHRGLAYHELKSFSFAFNDLEKALYLSRQKRDYRLAHLIAKDFKKSALDLIKSRLKLGLLPFTFSFNVILNTLFNLKFIFTQPRQGLLESYYRLDQKQIIAVSLVNGCISYFLFSHLNLVNPNFFNFLPFLGLIFISFMSRTLGSRYGQFSGDLFVAGSSLLPLSFIGGLLTFFQEINPVLKITLVLLGLGYTAFILDTGLREIANLPKKLTLFLMPLMLVVISFPFWGLFSIL
ncbi:heat shock protein DnaJ domain protein [Gloeothece citriformis PCC 7424]|uniref:Heat shock protein DnaJ domain protein n=1 Tax=Gloeothece citriformis (strain PCC 7424) TaxID=65393 RepID=B7KEW1_GLOC7|nr:DnaJ domain-containing protein [Gloeothece citriformis]ACK70417.1 heat shock protein DnaJ domain protein [Gloeothece citriformis PCC 7424]